MLKDLLFTLLDLLVLLLVFCWVVVAIRAKSREEYEPLPEPFDISQRTYVTIMAALTMLFGGVALKLVTHRYGIINPDGVSYLTIARRYAAGDFVIRGYWSPLISWLLAPMIAAGFDIQISRNLLASANSLLFAYLSLPLAKRFGVGRIYRVCIFIIMAILALKHSYTMVAPDLLGAAFVLLYLLIITSPRTLKHPIGLGLLAGLMGALAYYGKYYNAAFVAAFFIVHAGFLWFTKAKKRKQIILATLAGISAMFVIMLPWLIGIYRRYDSFTITTSSAINATLVAYSVPLHVWDTFYPGPDDVLFAWEDPDPQYYEPYSWSPLEQPDHFIYGVIMQGFKNWQQTMNENFSYLALFSIITGGIAVILFWQQHEQRYQFIWLMMGIFIYTSGYMMSYSRDLRYYLAIIPLILIPLFYWLQAGTQAIQFLQIPPMWQKILAFALLGLIMVVFVYHSEVDDLRYPIPVSCYQTDAEEIDHLLIPPLAGDSQGISYIGYFTEKRAYGPYPATFTPEDINSANQEVNARTLLLADSDIIATLHDDFAYTIVDQVTVCNQDYTILTPPSN